jgi:hypothetical protein
MIVARHEYMFSGPIVLVLVLVLGWGIEAGLPGWKREERRKQIGGRFARVTRETDEDEGRGRARLGHGAKHVQARSAWDGATQKEPSLRVRCDSCRCAHRFDDWSDKN